MGIGKNYCTSVHLLFQNMNGCRQNKVLSDAAKICVLNLERQIEAEKKALAIAMAAEDLNTKSAQESQISNHQINLAMLTERLAELKRVAGQARGEVLSYTNFLQYPNGQTPSQYRGPKSLHVLAKKLACYADNHNSLVESTKQIDRKILDIKKTESTAWAVKKTTDAFAAKMKGDSSLNTAFVAPGVASVDDNINGGPSVTPKNKDRAPSSISGTEDIGKADRAMQKIKAK